MYNNSNGENYQECIVVYIDDLLVISEHPKYIMDSFSMYFFLNTVIPPDQYIGENVGNSS